MTSSVTSASRTWNTLVDAETTVHQTIIAVHNHGIDCADVAALGHRLKELPVIHAHQLPPRRPDWSADLALKIVGNPNARRWA
jgi:hypothetical protein